MATAVHIPMSEYLQAVYEPDCDYVDGELQERNEGDQSHGLIQAALARIFYANRNQWGLRVIPELRIRVSASRYRIPDVCAVPVTDPIVRNLTTPPRICIEILSPEDRLQRLVTRVQDYRSFGVEHIWIIDPESREVWTIDPASGGAVPMLEQALTIPGTPIRLLLSELFEEIDSTPKA